LKQLGCRVSIDVGLNLFLSNYMYEYIPDNFCDVSAETGERFYEELKSWKPGVTCRDVWMSA